MKYFIPLILIFLIACDDSSVSYEKLLIQRFESSTVSRSSIFYVDSAFYLHTTKPLNLAVLKPKDSVQFVSNLRSFLAESVDVQFDKLESYDPVDVWYRMYFQGNGDDSQGEVSTHNLNDKQQSSLAYLFDSTNYTLGVLTPSLDLKWINIYFPSHDNSYEHIYASLVTEKRLWSGVLKPTKFCETRIEHTESIMFDYHVAFDGNPNLERIYRDSSGKLILKYKSGECYELR